MQDTARDSTSGGEALKITSPSIPDVLAAYLAEDIARFATMLRAWTISCGWDGANLLDGVCAKEALSHTSDPSTRPALEALSSF